MQKAILISVLLISGSAIQMASASEHHQTNRSKAYFGRDISDYRGSYNQVGPITVVPPTLDRFDPATPRNEGPTLNPPGS